MPGGIDGGTDDNADNDGGEAAFPPQGGADNTNDFGFYLRPNGRLAWRELGSHALHRRSERGRDHRRGAAPAERAGRVSHAPRPRQVDVMREGKWIRRSKA